MVDFHTNFLIWRQNIVSWSDIYFAFRYQICYHSFIVDCNWRDQGVSKGILVQKKNNENYVTVFNFFIRVI